MDYDHGVIVLETFNSEYSIKANYEKVRLGEIT
jgi:hypothetical protein